MSNTPIMYAAASSGASAKRVDELLLDLRSPDENVRTAAWQKAPEYGAEAVQPLAGLLEDKDFETARAAKRALYHLVRRSGRPGAESDAGRVSSELLALLKAPPVEVRRQALWLLSEIGPESAITDIARLLRDSDVREDARCALLRIPSPRVAVELSRALGEVPDDFKPAVADALRSLGEIVAGHPSLKKTPVRQTEVQSHATGASK